MSCSEIVETIKNGLECKLAIDDVNCWNNLCAECVEPTVDCAPLQYKIDFNLYQEAYFQEVYEEYHDVSLILNRGGKAVGIWPLAYYIQNGKFNFCSSGGAIVPPILSRLPKTEAKRAVYEQCISVLFELSERFDIDELQFSEVIMQCGFSAWHQKLMEHGAKCHEVKHQLFVDLALSDEEIQSRIRRTNKYSIAKGEDDYDICIYDETSPDLDKIFDEFRALHIRVAGRKTRSKHTWEMQERTVLNNTYGGGYSFVVFIRDKHSGELAGAALFDSTCSCGLYCVAAYDRERFSRPVGHIVQAVAMKHMREKGVRWYEIGERPYFSDCGATQKTVDIGFYKEGFATHIFAKIINTISTKKSVV